MFSLFFIYFFLFFFPLYEIFFVFFFFSDLLVSLFVFLAGGGPLLVVFLFLFFLFFFVFRFFLFRFSSSVENLVFSAMVPQFSATGNTAKN